MWGAGARQRRKADEWCKLKPSRITIRASKWCRQRLWFCIGLDSRGSSVPRGKGEAFGGRGSCFHLGKHGRLPIETLPLYFRKLPKSLEENNMFPLQLSGEIREGGGHFLLCFEAGFCSLTFIEDLAPTPVACKLRSGIFLRTRKYYPVGSSNTVNFHIEICLWSKAFHHSNEVSS